MRKGRLACLESSMAGEPVKAKPRFARCFAALTDPLGPCWKRDRPTAGEWPSTSDKGIITQIHLHKILDRTYF